ncbi:cellular morphogenesis protein [Colletotrichum plurivorum]|uniref:Cellular morphogenesis protein n=1 Tax=Colletotrichum plurivorum TaxID=2175906 RepID=A0A8H6K2L0_9PEZI|nr:cellular morphogenesis protein [Colletotrichum plurivorum]
MVKRKRSRESDLDQKLAEARKEIFRALKGAKGLERQRYSKRMRDDKSTPDKLKRLEREVLVLKSLDLQQTADAHLNSSLLKVKQLAESPNLPEDIKRGVPKPELSEEEKAALHNVTSGLFNRVHVKEAVDKAVRAVCMILNVPLPDKKKRARKTADNDREETDEKPRAAKETKKQEAKEVSVETGGENSLDEMDFDVPTRNHSTKVDDIEDDDIDQDEQEMALEKMEAMLGGSDEEDGSIDEDLKAKYQALLDEVPEGDTADDESNSDGSDVEDDEDMGDLEDEDEGMDSDRRRRIDAANVSLSPSPPPAARKAKAARAQKASDKSGQTTFLPSLMGGYISNSESEASDLDLAPPKKRLGQKQRQAIWEKKYGSQANHVKKQSQQQRGKGRDSGWDMRKGAVEGDDRGGKPWKRGVSNPLGGSSKEGDRQPQPSFQKRTPAKKDDEGPLHPSWEARKKAKEMQTTAAFQGTKITF